MWFLLYKAKREQFFVPGLWVSKNVSLRYQGGEGPLHRVVVLARVSR